ncbi:hypothetical protein HF086_008815, partial [Spodoptera exigua]
ASRNPFDSDTEITLQPSTSGEKPQKSRKRKIISNIPKQSKKTAPPPDLSEDSETEPVSTARKQSSIFSDSEDDAVEPVRAAALRSYLARRVGSGYTLQRDPPRSGQFYIELRVYDSKEAETLAANRWKRALFTLRSSHDDSGPVWKALTGLVSAAKQEYARIKPILYPSNVF